MADDDDDDTKKFKVMMGVAIAFIVSMVVSCQELNYTIWGKTTDASVSRMEEVTVHVGKFRREERRMRLHMTYDDDGAQVKVIDSFPIDADYSTARATGKLRIQYLAGDKYSARLPGTGNVLAVVVFFGLLGALALYILKCFLDARRQ